MINIAHVRPMTTAEQQTNFNLNPENEMNSVIIVYKENDVVVETTVNGNNIRGLDANALVGAIRSANASIDNLSGITGTYSKQEKARLKKFIKDVTALLDEKFTTTSVTS